jgi:hypothetical protein
MRAKKRGSTDSLEVKRIPADELSGSTEDTTPIRVVVPRTGESVRMDSHASMTGAEALKSIRPLWRSSLEGVLSGLRLPGVMFRMTNRQLVRLVGDIEIDFVSDADMRQIKPGMEANRTPAGVYLNYSPGTRAKGLKPRILINKDYYDSVSPGRQARLIMHEMTHAATSYALKNDIRGTNRIVDRLRKDMAWALVQRYGAIPREFEYAFTNNREFVAEGFSNPAFQELLQLLPVDPYERRVIGAMVEAAQHSPVGVWWQRFLGMVSNALAPFLRKGQISFLEELVKIAPQMSMTSAEQLADAKAKAPSGRKGWEEALHPLDVDAMIVDMESAVDAAKLHGKVGSGKLNRASLKFQTTENMKRNAGYWFDAGAEKFRKLADLFLSTTPRRRKYLEKSDAVVQQLANEYHRDARSFDKAADLVFDATKYRVDISVPLSHPNNKHIKKGDRNVHQRVAHMRLHPEWQKLPAQTQKAFLDAMQLLKDQENSRVEMTVRDILTTAMRPSTAGGLGVTLPTGVSVDDAVKWVLDGGIDRLPGDPANPKATDQTPADAALHKALGKTADSLKGTKEMRRIQGMYAPLMRWGKYFFTARKKIATPAGATLLRQDKSGLHFGFTSKKELNDFQNKSGDLITNVAVEWIDPLTGKKTKKQNQYVDPATGQLVIPTRRFRAVVQDRYMEMAENEAELTALQEEYRKNGFADVSDVAVVDNILHANEEMLPAHINRLLRSVEQSHAGATSPTQANVQGAIVSAYIRQLGGNRAQHRRLKRNAVGGHSKDFLRAMHSASTQMAAQLAHLELAPQIAEADADLSKYINDNRYAGSGKTAMRQAAHAELKVRMKAHNTRTENTTGDRWLNATMATSFISHLMSPAYSIFNAVGGITTGWGVLAGEFGVGTATREMTKALAKLGAARLWGAGVAETGRTLRQSFGSMPRQARNYDDHVLSRTKGVAGFDKVVGRMNELGFGASSGIEEPGVTELGMNKAEKVISRTARIARAAPEAVETVNRYVTALAYYNAARRAGRSEEAAREGAVSAVEKSQGGYATENNPAYMSSKLTRLPMQFKKYPLMYAQLYFGAMVKMISPGSDRATRVQAAKTFTYLSAVTVALAGTHGLPFMEIAKIFFLVGAMFGLDDGDWEDKENALQRFYAEGFEWMLGKKSNAEFYSEMLAYGLPRAMAMETSSRLGNASMLTFGAPKTGKEGVEWASWILDQVVGAPGAMFQTMQKAWSEGDYWKFAPMPKVLKDTLDAVEKSQEGTLNKAGRQILEPPAIGEAALKGAGIKPASEARHWEAFGEGAESKAEQKMKTARTRLIGEWANADPRDRSKVWRDVIQPWNKANPKNKITRSSLLRSKAARKAQERKEKREDD